MMEQAIQDSGGKGAVVVKYLRPLFEDAVWRNNQEATLISVADNLEEQVSASLVDGQVSQFVKDKQGGFRVKY